MIESRGNFVYCGHMTFWAGWFRGVLFLLGCLLLSGCIPSGSGLLDEEKEPHFLAGKSRISTLDYKGAIECFEKALQVNPQSASAYFELAWLFDQKQINPVSAIYHYEHYLKLRPSAGNADLARQRILVCKQTLAETVSFGPVTEKMQRQIEQVTGENKRLTDENKHLLEALEKWSGYAARLQTLTNQAGPNLLRLHLPRDRARQPKPLRRSWSSRARRAPVARHRAPPPPLGRIRSRQAKRRFSSPKNMVSNWMP